MYYIFIFLFVLNAAYANQGKIIVFSGLSGTGKSTMARLLAPKINAEYLVEPEEKEWPIVVQKRDTYGPSEALFALRQLWVKLFIDATNLRNAGKMVCIDTYFLKTIGYYIDQPNMEWLIPANDAYVPLLKQLFTLDEILIPDADCVVLFDVSIEDWQQFLKARKRNWETMPGFLELFIQSKKYLDEATIAHCTKYNIPLIHFKQQFGDPDLQAERLKEML